MTFDEIMSLVQNEMKLVEDALYSNIDTNVKVLDEVIRYLISSGGKRIRPLLTVLSAKAVSSKSTKYIELASIIEYLHNATLLHDDIIDGATYRRNIPSANNKYGNDIAVLTGDYLYSRSYILLTDIENIGIQKILSKVALTMSEGEVIQLISTAKLDTTLDDYLKIIRSKTAVLFSAACEVGAIIGNVKEKEAKYFAEFGEKLGIAFQMSDDLLDYIGDETETGKNRGTDLKEGKITIPVLLLLELVESDVKEKIGKIILSDNIAVEEFDYIRNLIVEHSVDKMVSQMVLDNMTEAINALSTIKDSDYKTALISLANLLINRKN